MQNSKLQLKERTYIYALKIIKLIDSLQKDQTCKVIGSQLLRSATSIGANIIEAQAGSSRKDFTKFFNYALKSSNESKFWIGLLRDSEKINKNDANILLQETNEISNILGSSVLTLRGKKL